MNQPPTDDPPGPAPESRRKGHTKGGAPPHEWNPEIAAKITTMAERGVRLTRIADVVGIAVNTMRRHYIKEMVLADARVQELIGSAQLTVALGRKAEYDEKGNLVKAELLPNPTMLIFLGKARLGQREVEVQEFYDRTNDEATASTAGLTESERVARLATIADRARARRTRRPATRASAVGAIPGSAKPGAQKQG